MPVYKFRNCLLNTAERLVIKDNQHIDLTTKTFDVLEFLVENAGRTVTKDEFLGKVWNGDFVEESNLPVHISKLRRALGETRANRFVETVQGMGYRFVARVLEIADSEWPEMHELINEFNSSDFATGYGPNSLAVLPLENETGTPNNNYLADGLTEGLINSFSHIRGLKIIARDTVFRLKDQKLNLKQIAEALGVSAILTGRVRGSEENISIGVELINSANGSQIWGDLYYQSFPEMLGTQRKIVTAVSEQLLADPFHGISSSSGLFPENEESYKLYLTGKYCLRKRTTSEVERAITYFRKAISYSNKSIHSRVAIVEAYCFLYALDHLPRSEVLSITTPILQELTDVRGSIDIVELMLGRHLLKLHWNFHAAESHFSRALSLNPNSAEAHCCYADLMAMLGRRREAEVHANQLLALDPMSLPSWNQVARVHYKLGQYDTAIRYLEGALEMEPEDFETLLLLGAAYTELTNYVKALECFEASLLIQKTAEGLAMIGHVYGIIGNRDAVNEIVSKRLDAELGVGKTDPLNLARIYVGSGDRETAYSFLEQALADHAMEMYALESDPRWKTIRSEARFKTLIQLVATAKSK